MGFPEIVKQFKGLFAKQPEGEPKKQEKLKNKYGLKSGGTVRCG